MSLDPPLLLAPMAGFSDAPMRWICHRHGAAFVYTEMANARAVSAGVHASWRILETLEGEGPVAAHLYGSDPEDFAGAAERISLCGRFSSIDINCGCPVPKVMQCGAGAALMAEPERIGRIVAAAVRHGTLPVTVKTRIGLRPGEDAVRKIARIVADQGAAALAVHGRYATQHHAGPVHFDRLAEVVRLERLPIIGNGGIRTSASALDMFRKTGVAAVMVGWGAVGNPWLLENLRIAMKTGEAAIPTDVPVAAVRKIVHEHLNLILTFKKLLGERWPEAVVRVSDEESAVLDFRCQLFRYLNGMRGASRLRARLGTLHTLSQVSEAIEETLASEAEFRARIGRA